jgi:hypothetical protein
VHVIGANDAKSEPKIRGMTVCGAYVDEVTLVPQIFFEQLLRPHVRARRPTVLHHQPGQPRALVHAGLAVPGRQEARLPLQSFTIDDNPFLDEDYVADMKASHEGLFYRRFILGEWVAAEGAIYDSWDRERHIVTLPPKTASTSGSALGVDYGTSNPFHAVLLGLGRGPEAVRGGGVAVRGAADEEAAHRHRVLAAAARLAARRAADRPVRPQFITVDPSAASFVTQLKRDKLTPTPAKNDVMDGIRTVSSLLAANKLLVHESCKA